MAEGAFGDLPIDVVAEHRYKGTSTPTLRRWLKRAEKLLARGRTQYRVRGEMVQTTREDLEFDVEALTVEIRRRERDARYHYEQQRKGQTSD